MTPQQIFIETGVLQTGHFRLTSGRHSDQYMQCARVFQYADKAGELCALLAEKFKDASIDCVIGPAIGALQMAYEMGRCLGVRNIFAERDADGKMVLRRGFTVTEGERFLVVEDTVTTGGTVKEVIELVRASGGVAAGVGSIVDRSGGTVDFGVPFAAVSSVSIESWEPDACPLCKAGQPIVKPGSRK